LLKQREETFRKKLTEELETQVRQARREIDEVIADLRKKTAALTSDTARLSLNTGKAGAARGDARAAVDLVAERLLTTTPGADVPAATDTSRAAAVGDRVMVGGLGLEGVVTTIHDGSAEIDVRGKRMRAAVRDLRVIGGGAPKQEKATPQVRVNVDLTPRDGSITDLNVIGCTVDEALARTERFLDESLLTDQRTLRVIHGYGTGQLKRAIGEFLHQHPLVATVTQAPPNQGGGGVTVIELKD
jgi:DNA mismatch repair protein MutS2